MSMEDDIARAEALAAAERETIDAAASEDTIKPVEANADGRPMTRDEERAYLGFSPAWWAEDEGWPPLDIAVDLTGQACGRTKYLRKLEEHGYDPATQISYIGLDAATGPLVVTALQLLGTLHEHVRDEVKTLLKQIFDATPDVTPEQEEAFNAADAALEEAALREFAQNMGIIVSSVDEFAEQVVEDHERRADAGLN